VPDFTVIQGGGPPRGRDDAHDSNARYHLSRLIVEILRGLARGDDPRQRIVTELGAFLDHVNASATPIDQTITRVIAAMHGDLNVDRRHRPRQIEIEAIALASLRFAAETCAHDDATKGRASSRRSDLDRSIELYSAKRFSSQAKPRRNPPGKRRPTQRTRPPDQESE
jgi:hypothetical protein